MKSDKMTGDERRSYITELLKHATEPITGQLLAEKTGVSRQVIVTDIALLRANGEAIMATSRGYVYQIDQPQENLYQKVVVCRHTPEQTQDELHAIVDCGVTIINVIVEHPFYGDLTGSLMINSRYDVNRFIEAFSNQEAALLSVLTDGTHLHTLSSDSMEKIEAACEALKNLGILVTENR